MKKKLTTELTTEELLNQLESTDIQVEGKRKVTQHKFHKILDFISKYNIKSGNNPITSKILFELFKLEYPEVQFKSFVFQMKRLLPYKRPRHVVIFYIDKNQLDVTDAIKRHYITPKTVISRQRNLKKHVESFIKYFNLNPGNNAINFKIVVDLYDRWTYKFKKKKVSNQVLSNLLKHYFEFYKHSNNTDRYFKFDNGIFKVISERQLRNMGK